jgi:hypothetical protein
MSTAPVQWLYVPKEDVAQALAFGASFRQGDSRMVAPRPLPSGITESHFARWKGSAAVARFLREQAAEIVQSEGYRLRSRSPEDTAHADTGRERVYLWVRRTDAAEVRKMPGVGWDRRRRLFYAKRTADLNVMFRWLTPAARAEWEAEQATLGTVEQLVREEASREFTRRRAGAGGGSPSRSGTPSARDAESAR